MTRQVVVVGSEAGALHGLGKVSPAAYFPILRNELDAVGSVLSVYRRPQQFLARAEAHRGAVLIAIWNEEHNKSTAAGTLAEMAELEAACAALGIRVINDSRTGRIVADKPTANRVLSPAVPMPRMLSEGRAFSAALSGSSQEVALVDAAAPEAAGRYNVELVDTVHAFGGGRYYVSLRALAVGRELISVFPSCRPVSDGDLSVHAKNTSLEPDLLMHLQATIGERRRREIAAICRRAGSLLGDGFFAYDLLPDAGSGRLLVSEVGLKLDDTTIADHLAPIASQLDYFENEIGDRARRRSARSFIRQYLGVDALLGRARKRLGQLRRAVRR